MTGATEPFVGLIRQLVDRSAAMISGDRLAQMIPDSLHGFVSGAWLAESATSLARPSFPSIRIRRGSLEDGVVTDAGKEDFLVGTG